VISKDAIYAFMKQHRFGVLSSIAGDRRPQSALMGIAVTPELEIVFDTVRSTRKYRNLIERPDCSFVVGWGGEQTVQYEGAASELTGAELVRYQETYFAAWPSGQSRVTWPGITYFVVRPRWIRYSDFDQTPQLVEEINFTQADREADTPGRIGEETISERR
jgi:hypothetical protein